MPIDSSIRHYIQNNGHIKIDDMMKSVLSISSESYYRATKTLGSDGDFITSPEISQLFGEVIALWAIEKWQLLGKPAEFVLLEIGPGRGKLMQDFLRVSQLVPSFFKAIELYLYDINPNFIEAQKNNLASYNKNIIWLESLSEMPNKPIIILANEFFDALPIKQYIKIKEQWFERNLIEDPSSGQLKFGKVAINSKLHAQFLIDHKNAKDGAVFEESVESMQVLRQLGAIMAKNTGAALIIDYGYNIDPFTRNRYQYNSTLQAVKNHQYCPIIDSLGESDLTAHVDFNALLRAVKEQGVNSFFFSDQKDFLVKYGIFLRQNMLKKTLSKDDYEIVERQVFRLTSPEAMGELFKVLELEVLP